VSFFEDSPSASLDAQNLAVPVSKSQVFF